MDIEQMAMDFARSRSVQVQHFSILSIIPSILRIPNPCQTMLMLSLYIDTPSKRCWYILEY